MSDPAYIAWEIVERFLDSHGWQIVGFAERAGQDPRDAASELVDAIAAALATRPAGDASAASVAALLKAANRLRVEISDWHLERAREAWSNTNVASLRAKLTEYDEALVAMPSGFFAARPAATSASCAERGHPRAYDKLDMAQTPDAPLGTATPMCACGLPCGPIRPRGEAR